MNPTVMATEGRSGTTPDTAVHLHAPKRGSMKQVAEKPRARRRQNGAAHEALSTRPLGALPAERRAEICHEVLTAYAMGKQVRELAPAYGVSDVTLYALLLREQPEQWKAVQTARALARLEHYQHEMQTADDQISLARARELVRAAQFELERLLAKFYGPKQEVTHHHRGDLEAAIQAAERRERARLIESTAEVVDATEIASQIPGLADAVADYAGSASED